MRFKKNLDWLLNPLVIGSAILIALVLLVITFLILWASRPQNLLTSQTTAIVQIIPVPTATPTNAVSQPQASTPTDPSSQDTSNEISAGDHIQIAGTGGDGLRLRINPGLDNQIMFIGVEGEVFVVEDGPIEKDGYVWWYLISVEDSAIKGWGVSDFMEEIEIPES